jgi:5-formyltetrahydrofolate cyclo-ligase
VSKAKEDPATLKAELRKALLAKWRSATALDFSDSKVGIPNFRGAQNAAERLANEAAFDKARTVLTGLEDVLQPLRTRAMTAHKTLVAFEKLATGPLQFLVLDPSTIPVSNYERASSGAGFPTFARRVAVSAIPNCDFAICAALAVDASGGRLGDGSGVFDLAYATLRELGKLSVKTQIATLVHRIQVLEAKIPMTKLDAPVDLIFTHEDRLLTRTKHARPAKVGGADGGL